MNDTPRVDAKVFNFLNAHPSMNMNQDVVRAEFARDLERENTARRGVEAEQDEQGLLADIARIGREHDAAIVRAERAEAANVKLVGAIDMIRETLSGGNVEDLLLIINNALDEAKNV